MIQFGQTRIRRRGLVGIKLEALAMFPVLKGSIRVLLRCSLHLMLWRDYQQTLVLLERAKKTGVLVDG